MVILTLVISTETKYCEIILKKLEMPKHRVRGNRVYIVLLTNEKNKAFKHFSEFSMEIGFCQDRT